MERRQIGWGVLYGGMTAASTLAARRLATKSWVVLTGERPPGMTRAAGPAPPAPAPAAPAPAALGSRPADARETGRTRPADTTVAPIDGGGRHGADDQPQPQPERAEPALADPGLTDLSKRDWVAVFKRAGKEALDDNVPLIASALAYSSFFAIPSVLLVAVGLFSLIAGPDTIANLMQHFQTFMPGDATALLGDSLHRLDEKPSTGVTMTIVGFVLALWATTGAMNAYMTALNIAYDRKDRRSFAKKRIVALQMAGCIGFAFLLVAVLVIFGPAIEHWVGTTLHIQPVLKWVWWVAQWPLVIAGLLAAFATMYWLGPDVDHPKWEFLTVGAAVSVVVWLATSGLFAVYTSMFASYNKTWGSLSAVIVMMTWLWLTGIALLFGGEVNAEIARSRELRQRV